MLLDISINIRILYRHRLQQRERKMEKNTLSNIKVTRIEASVGEMCLMVKCLWSSDQTILSKVEQTGLIKYHQNEITWFFS